MALIEHNRRSLRLQDYDYSQPGAYFVTICVKDRKCLLGSVTDGEMRLAKYGLIAAKSWQWLSSAYPYISLDEWTIMPNHFHGIIFINEPMQRAVREPPLQPPTQRTFAVKPIGGRIQNRFQQTD